MSGETQALVGRCYTKARRHPGMVGRWPGGGRIPGGPYTLQQACVAGGAFGLLFLTREVWGIFGLGNYAALLAAPLVAGRAGAAGAHRRPLTGGRRDEPGRAGAARR